MTRLSFEALEGMGYIFIAFSPRFILTWVVVPVRVVSMVLLDLYKNYPYSIRSLVKKKKKKEKIYETIAQRCKYEREINAIP